MIAGILLTNILESTCLLRFLFIKLLQAPSCTPRGAPGSRNPDSTGLSRQLRPLQPYTSPKARV